MQPQRTPAARPFMQAVDILRHKREPGRSFFKTRQRDVPGVGLRAGAHGTSPVVPLPYQLRFARECRGRGQFLGAKLFPESARTAKGRDAALRRDPRARKRDNPARNPQKFASPMNQLLVVARSAL